MKYTISIEIPGGSINLEADSQKQVFEELSFWQSLPKVCPVDGSPVRLNTRDAKTSKGAPITYYELVSTSYPIFRGHVGQSADGSGALFYDGTWSHFDGQTETEIFARGKMVVDLEKYMSKFSTPSPKLAQPKPAASQPEPEPEDGQIVSGKMALLSQIETLFDNNPLAGRWLVKRWTTKFTPTSIRTEVDSMTDSECQKLADMCAQFAEKLVAEFNAYLAAGKTSGK